MKIATIPLSSCCGCHVGLVNLGEDLLAALAGGALVYSPVLMDAKSIPECDVALVEGGLRNAENTERLRELRAKSKILIALGTCASFGGIPGIGSAFNNEELLERAYGKGFSPEDIPALEPRVSPIDACVEVDFYIPGCPPPPAVLANALTKLLSGAAPERIDLPVCAECRRSARKEIKADIKRTLDERPAPDECLLSQGYICLGSVSRGGCTAACTGVGVPCMGCRGAIDRVLTDRTHGILYDLTRRISHFTGKTEKEVEAKMTDLVHTIYSFSFSVPEMRPKDAERISKLIHRITV